MQTAETSDRQADPSCLRQAGALLACVFTALVPYADAFSGFAHPAVITVACSDRRPGAQRRAVVNAECRPLYACRRILIIEAEAEALATALSSLGLVLQEARHKAEKEETGDADAAEGKGKVKAPLSDEIVLVELLILPTSDLLEHTPTEIRAQTRQICSSSVSDCGCGCGRCERVGGGDQADAVRFEWAERRQAAHLCMRCSAREEMLLRSSRKMGSLTP